MKLGANAIALYLGATEIKKAYLGTTEVFSAAAPEPISFSGDFNAADSLAPVMSEVRTATVPPGNTGEVRVEIVSMTGSATGLFYRANPPSPIMFNHISHLGTFTLTNGAAVTLRGAFTSGSGEISGTLRDVTTGSVITSFTIERW